MGNSDGEKVADLILGKDNRAKIQGKFRQGSIGYGQVAVKTIVDKVGELNLLVWMQIVPTQKDVVDSYWRF
jgi:hypothetical protein